MSFETYTLGGRRQSVKPGECAMQASGYAILSTHDLRRAGINGRAVIEIDRVTFRLALRAPVDDEPTLSVVGRGTTARVYLGGAAALLGIPARKQRRPTTFKENLLIIQFEGHKPRGVA